MATAKSEARRERRRQRKKVQRINAGLESGAVLRVRDKSAELLLYGTIGDEFFGGTGSREIVEDLQKLASVEEVTVRINSSGGDVFEGFAIYNALSKHSARIVVEIEGLAASIASLIAMAGDEVNIAENALLMLHNPHVFTAGEADDLREQAELLEKVTDSLVSAYVSKSGLGEDRIRDMLDEETWLSAQEARDLGFVDGITRPKKMAACIDASKLNVPDEYKDRFPDSTFKRSITPAASTASSEEFAMDPKLRAMLIDLGMPEEHDDDQAQEWMVENKANFIKGPESPDAKAKKDPPKKPEGVDLKALDDWYDRRERQKAAAKRKFRSEVDASIKLAFGDAVPGGLADKCYGAEDLDAARKIIMDRKAEGVAFLPGGINASPEQPRDQHFKDVRGAFLHRTLTACANGNTSIVEKRLPKAELGPGVDRFRNFSLLAIAEECLLVDGYSYHQLRSLTRENLAKAALGFPHKVGLRAEGYAFHTTGSFAEITKDAVNKSLLTGYEEAPQTWRGPMRQASSVPDFKTIHRIRLGAAPNLPVWPDNTNPEVASMRDEEVTYAVEARAEEVNFSWRLMVNDDMDAFSRIPMMLGDAAGRTVNAVAWNQVTSNPTMPYDSQSLFSNATGNRQRDNLSTGASSPPSVSTIGTMTALMRLMRGVNTPENNESEDPLNLSPRFLVVPATEETTAKQLVRSVADPADDKSSVVYNPGRELELIVEPLLDANSTTAYYLFADPRRIDTIEVTFLQGQETPVTNDWVDERTMSRSFTIVQTFNAKAIDHRGVQKHTGAS